MKNVDLVNFHNWALSKNVIANEDLYCAEFNWFVLHNYETLIPIVDRWRRLEFVSGYTDFLAEQEILMQRYADKREPGNKYIIIKNLDEYQDAFEKLQIKHIDSINKQSKRDKKYSRLMSQESDPQIMNQLITVKLKYVPKLSTYEFGIIKPLIKD
jgi:hypothetical protein